jgi:hypothetical protein
MTQLSMELYLWRYLLGCELYIYIYIYIYRHTHKYSQINQELYVLISEKKILNYNSK